MFLFVSGHNGLEVDSLTSERASRFVPYIRGLVLEVDGYVLLPFKMTPFLKFLVTSDPLRFPFDFSLTV